MTLNFFFSQWKNKRTDALEAWSSGTVALAREIESRQGIGFSFLFKKYMKKK
jgi:hypothetical protein